LQKRILLHERKLFREALLNDVTLIQQIRNALERKSDRAVPLEFFRDILDEHLSQEDVQRQIHTALNLGAIRGDLHLQRGNWQVAAERSLRPRQFERRCSFPLSSRWQEEPEDWQRFTDRPKAPRRAICYPASLIPD
jgi:hypothetical protein